MGAPVSKKPKPVKIKRTGKAQINPHNDRKISIKRMRFIFIGCNEQFNGFYIFPNTLERQILAWPIRTKATPQPLFDIDYW